MINLYTPSDEMWTTLSEEYEKAKYWMIKQLGGEKRYEAMRDKLLRRCVYGQRSKTQTARTERVRNLSEVVRYEPEDVAKRRLELCDNPVGEFNKKMEKMHALGLDTSRQEEGLSVNYSIGMAFMKMGIATIYDLDFWDRFNKVSHESINYYLNRSEEAGKDFMVFKELVVTAREIAARLGIKKFAWRDFAHILLVDGYKLSDSEATDVIKSLYQ